jgi:hypothetical protein
VTRARATLASTAGLVLVTPRPALAHAVGPGAGVEIELLVLAAAVTVVGISRLSTTESRAWVAWTIIGVGVALGALSVALPRIGGPSRPDATVAILAPRDGATVPAGEPVELRIEVDGGSIARSPTDTEKGHLHLYLDGELQQMPYSTTAAVTLEPGVHDLTVEYVDPQHISYDPPVVTTVEVEAAAPGS